MPRALATRAEVEARLTAARLELIEYEDAGYTDLALIARERCDTLLDLLWTLIPQQRQP